MTNTDTLTQVTNLTNGQAINVGGRTVIVDHVQPYGERETFVIGSKGERLIFANTNWF